eukprot:9298217-Pyramimonas_sp.AAC.2
MHPCALSSLCRQQGGYHRRLNTIVIPVPTTGWILPDGSFLCRHRGGYYLTDHPCADNGVDTIAGWILSDGSSKCQQQGGYYRRVDTI